MTSTPKRRITTPGEVVLFAFIWLSTTALLVGWLWGIISHIDVKNYEEPWWVSRAELQAISRRLPAEAEMCGFFYPEGRLFCYTFYGFALVNLGLSRPGIEGYQDWALSEIARVLPKAEQLAVQKPFDYCKDMSPKGGVIPAGQINLLRAGYIILGGSRKKFVDDFHAGSKELFDALQASPNGLLESYPGFMIWPCDNCCALESLRLHDKIYGTNYQPAIDRFNQFNQKFIDPETGLMIAQLGTDGKALGGPRGCGISWALAFLPSLDPEFARQQYALYRKSWFIPVLGCMGIREWPPGRTGEMDVDTGGVFGDIGAAASGLGIATTKVMNDKEAFVALGRSMEAAGFPCWNLWIEKNFFMQNFLLGDVLGVWGKTLCIWDNVERPEPDPSWQHLAIDNYWIVVVSASVIVFALEFVLIKLVWSAIVSCRNFENRWAKVRKGVFYFQLAVALLWICWPGFLWTQAIAIMAITDMMDKMWLRADLIRNEFAKDANKNPEDSVAREAHGPPNPPEAAAEDSTA